MKLVVFRSQDLVTLGFFRGLFRLFDLFIRHGWIADMVAQVSFFYARKRIFLGRCNCVFIKYDIRCYTCTLDGPSIWSKVASSGYLDCTATSEFLYGLY